MALAGVVTLSVACFCCSCCAVFVLWNINRSIILCSKGSMRGMPLPILQKKDMIIPTPFYRQNHTNLPTPFYRLSSKRARSSVFADKWRIWRMPPAPIAENYLAKKWHISGVTPTPLYGKNTPNSTWHLPLWDGMKSKDERWPYMQNCVFH